MHILLVTTLMELKRIYHDKRRTLILVLGPILICLIFGFVFYYNPKNVDITFFVDQFNNPNPTIHAVSTRLMEAIDTTDRFEVTRVHSLDDAFHRLSEGKTRAVVIVQESEDGIQAVKATVDVTDKIMQEIIQIELPQIIDLYTKHSAVELIARSGASPDEALRLVYPFDIDVKTNEWRDIKYFDLGASGVIVLFIMGICLLMSVTAITSERSTGTIERVFASPYSNAEVILSRLLAYSLLACIVATLVIACLKLIFDIVLGDIFLVFLISILIGINAVAMGLLVSAVTNNELESVVGGIICWFQSMILMGYTWPLETMHPVYVWISRITPFSYGLHAIRRVNLNNWGLDQIWLDLIVLLVFILLQTVLGIRFLRRNLG